MTNLLDVKEHFAFGENWRAFAKLLDERRIGEAEKGMKRLFPNGELKGATFLDIGCGSGLSSLAALRLGVAHIDAVDIDPDSVATTRSVLSANVGELSWSARVRSVFDLDPSERQYDIVYSWGVLHHTGDIWRAVQCAAAMVKPGGHLAIALYRKTPWCGFWTREKRFYSRAPRFVRAAIRWVYQIGFFAHMLSYGASPSKFVREYHSARGMNFSHDVHDWLGGYPYESVNAKDVVTFLSNLGFTIVREFAEPPVTKPPYWSTCCDEWVAVKSL